MPGGGIELIEIPKSFKNRFIIDIRWTLYINFLELKKSEYDQVLLTDVRDVIFQDDLFKKFASYENYLGYSTEAKKIYEDTVCNANWIIKFFGHDEYEKLKKHKIICCGTVWGTVNEVIIFSHKMKELLTKSNFWGAEQAIANYLIYEKLLPIENILESDVNDGIVLTNGWDIQNDIRGDKIFNLSGKIPAVVHQYDRKDSTNILVNKIYRNNEIQPNKIYEDIGSNLFIFNMFMKRKEYSRALEKLINVIDNQPDENFWQGAFFRLVNLFDSVLAIKERTVTIELLEQAVCNALLISVPKPVDLPHVNHFIYILNVMKQRKHTIYKPFEMIVANWIWQAASMFAQNKDWQNSLYFIELLKNIDYTLSSEYYLLSAKVNRQLGNVNKALEDYKNALHVN